jgi:transcriptional regulator with XRE-family HTH domain
MTPAQSRAARALIGWSRRDLQDASGVSAETIRNIEMGKTPNALTLEKLLKAYTEQGLEFINSDLAQGVVFRAI